MLYALGCGCGPDELPFVYERDQAVLPTFATVGCYAPASDMELPGVDYAGLIHSAQSLVLHRPLAPEGEAIVSRRITDVRDRGSARGAVLVLETTLVDPRDDGVVAVIGMEMLARYNGGFGGPAADRPPAEPDLSRPEQTRVMATRPEQALIFRLSGDMNPLHADPEAAASAGFAQPILHGMCTYALCCRAVMQAYGLPPEAIAGHAARFSAPVYPGEEVLVAMRRAGAGIVFAARVGDRHVLCNGVTQVRA